MSERTAWAAGLATETDDGTVLDGWFPTPQLGSPPGDQALWPSETDLAELAGPDDDRRVRRVPVRRVIELDRPPVDAADAYLRLHLLSHRLVVPNSLALDGIFGLLANVVWTNLGPCSPDDFEATRLRLLRAGRGPVMVYGVDKFPRMVDYVVPSGVRIADGDRIRLGAYLAPGTTVMAAGFVNFNAGTLGTCMIEGRLAQGVVAADGADVGGGASTMGVLSGGGRQRVSLGERSLLGAQAGLGIALGADCVVEAGLYVTAGTKVRLTNWPGPEPDGATVKAVELSGRDGVLFRRNSMTGVVEAVAREGVGIRLNASLHAN